MSERITHERLKRVLKDFAQYLSGTVPPLLAVNSVALILRCPPEAIADHAHQWAAFQVQAHKGSVPLSVFLFQVAEKIHQLADLGLLNLEAVECFLDELTLSLLKRCPASERTELRARFRAIGRSDEAKFTRAQSVYLKSDAEIERATSREAAASEVASSTGESEATRRLSLLMSRLQGGGRWSSSSTFGQPAQTRSEVISELLATVATNARSSAELRQQLENLELGGLEEARIEALIRALTSSLPDWFVPATPEMGASSSMAKALRKIVTLAPDSGGARERFVLVIGEGIEQLNGGAAARALSIFQLAERMLADREVDAVSVEAILSSAHRDIDPSRLVELAREPAQHDLLRRLLAFFPGFSPERLVDELDGELDRPRRRLLLSLLEVTGESARPAIIDRMELCVADPQPTAWHYQRNLVFLLHRIPASGPVDERELSLVLEFGRLDRHPRLVGEAVVRLAQIAAPRAERALISLMDEISERMKAPRESTHGAEDLRRLLNLVNAGLIRSGSGQCLEAVVSHGLEPPSHILDSGERLAELRNIDLSQHPAIVTRLQQGLRQQLPPRFLGILVRRPGNVRPIIEALSGTATEPVRRALEVVVEEYAGHDAGSAAAEALARLGASSKTGPPAPTASRPDVRQPVPAPDESSTPDTAEMSEIPFVASTAGPSPRQMSLEGDLSVFALPNLLQSLAQNESTGRLSLLDDQGSTCATVRLAGGRVTQCLNRRLEGAEAFYELFEKPTAEGFRFDAASSEDPIDLDASLDVMSLLMEAMRRVDEYRRARALVADEAVLVPTDVRPTPREGEEDGVFIRELWTRLKEGKPPGECERTVVADSYRIRTLIAHWVVTGALKAE